MKGCSHHYGLLGRWCDPGVDIDDSFLPPVESKVGGLKGDLLVVWVLGVLHNHEVEIFVLFHVRTNGRSGLRYLLSSRTV